MKSVWRITSVAGKYVYRVLEAFLLIVCTWAIMAILLPYIKVNTGFTPAQNGVKIFIHSNGVHTDFVVPVRNATIHWDTLFKPADFAVDSSWNYIALGWGDKGFFLNTPTWADLKFSTAFVAASGIGESAVHASYMQSAPVAGDHTLSFQISAEQYSRLVNYIRNSLANGVQMINHAGYGQHDRFFEANGRYSLFKTCNEWTGDGMEEAGLPVGIWTPLEFGIMRSK